jgi:hypothetical protein
METAEKQSIFESTIEMQKEALSTLIETGKKVTEIYHVQNPLRYMMDATTSNHVTLPNSRVLKNNMITSAKIFTKQVNTLTKFQRERVRLFTKTQTEWLQNSEINVNKHWVEKIVELNDYFEKSYTILDEAFNKSYQHGFEMMIQYLEENTFSDEK